MSRHGTAITLSRHRTAITLVQTQDSNHWSRHRTAITLSRHRTVITLVQTQDSNHTVQTWDSNHTGVQDSNQWKTSVKIKSNQQPGINGSIGKCTITSPIDKTHTVLQKSLDCRPGLSWLNQVYVPNHPTPFVQNICDKQNMFARFTNRNQFDILMTVVANDKKVIKHAIQR